MTQRSTITDSDQGKKVVNSNGIVFITHVWARLILR